jgi:hypothetical protein
MKNDPIFYGHSTENCNKYARKYVKYRSLFVYNDGILLTADFDLCIHEN